MRTSPFITSSNDTLYPETGRAVRDESLLAKNDEEANPDVRPAETGSVQVR
jgi:hypothetical protein